VVDFFCWEVEPLPWVEPELLFFCWNWKNPSFQIFWNKSNTSPTLTSPQQSSKVLPIPSRRTTTLALPRARAQLPTEEVHHSDLSSKLRKDGKLTPQEHQCRLDNKLCLFCGTAGHIAKDCPKSSSASPKPEHPNLIRTNLRLLAWILKKD